MSLAFPLAGAVAAQQPDAGEPLIRWDWLGRHLDDIALRTVEHIQLTAIAVGVGLAVSLALGLVAVRYRWTATPIGWFSGALYAIPSLAFFGLLIPFTGFSIFTAEIALVAYTLSTLVRNVIAGLDGVPPAARAAADGLGYTPTQRFFKVDLPLAVPTVVAGLRIATVTTIGLVTVASAVGFGGYGVFITDGLNRDFPTPLILGSVLSLLLAIVADSLFSVLQRSLAPWDRVGRSRKPTPGLSDELGDDGLREAAMEGTRA